MKAGAFLAITASVNSTYKNSATSRTSFWKMALSTTNTIPLQTEKMGKHEVTGIFLTTVVIVTVGYSNRSPCSHLAADLNFSRYWWRRLSCPGRSIRVQVLPWIKEGGKLTHVPYQENINRRYTYPVTLNFIWSTVVGDGGLCALELSWQQLSNIERITSGQRSAFVRLDCNPQLLTRENRTVFPESHSPTRRTALLTVLLVRKYFRNTEKRRRYSRLLQLMTFTPGLRTPSFLPGLIHLIILNDNVPNQAKFRQYSSECRADIPALQQPLY